MSGRRQGGATGETDRSPAGALVRLPVATSTYSYEVIVGPGARHQLCEVIPPGAMRAVIVTQAPVGVTVDSGIEQEVVCIPDGEGVKTMSTVEELCRGFSRFSITRSDVVVAVGGGVVTDVAGFAASVYHRGVAFVNVATTLLAQVDAAIGGKTGVNLPEGKNLVGSFWQPSAVLCDTEVLDTLDRGALRSGYGEMAKYAFIGAPGLERLPLAEQIARCVKLKAAVVAEDEHEVTGRRAILNYGHTLAHALEADSLARSSCASPVPGSEVPGSEVPGSEVPGSEVPGSEVPGSEVPGSEMPGSEMPGSEMPGSERSPSRPIPHGEAVAIGLVFAAKLAWRLGRIDESRVRHHAEVVRSYGLDTSLPSGSDPDRLVSYMAGDKKTMFSKSGGLTFVLDGPQGVELVTGVDVAEVIATLADMVFANGCMEAS